jgi:two-component system NtrC family sensor kinase
MAGGTSHIIGRRIEIEAMRANGETFPVELTITEIRLPERRLFTAHLRDLTAAPAAEAEIQRQRDALHQSEKMAAFGSLLAGCRKC